MNINPSGCPTTDLDTILFNGPYDPQFHGPGPQYQNFKVKIPKGTPTGVTQINIARFFLIGVSSNDLFNASAVAQYSRLQIRLPLEAPV